MYQHKVDIIKSNGRRKRNVWKAHSICCIGGRVVLQSRADTWYWYRQANVSYPNMMPVQGTVSTVHVHFWLQCGCVCFLGIQDMWGTLAKAMESGKYKNSGCLFVPRCQFSSLSGTRSPTRRQLELFSRKHICQMRHRWFNFSSSHRTCTTTQERLMFLCAEFIKRSNYIWGIPTGALGSTKKID